MEVMPASILTIDEVATVFNTAFKGYAGVGTSFTGETLAAWNKRHFITLERSYAFYNTPDSGADSSDSSSGFSSGSARSPVAFALMAERPDKPHHIRLGAMGAVTKAQGYGYRALQIVVQEECKRGTKVLELECIQNNPAGLALYKKAGFEILRELPGWETDVVTEFEDDEELEEVDVQEVQRVFKVEGGDDIPWQADDFAMFPFANRGFKLGQAYCVIGNPEAPEPKNDSSSLEEKKGGEASTIKLATLFVLPSCRRQGQGTRLAKAMMGRFKGHKWYAAPIFPREFGEGISRKVGGRELETMLVQMRLRL